MGLLDDIDGWRGFVANDPGHEFDGVDIAEGENGPQVVAGYGKDGAGNRKQYSSEMRGTIEDMVAAQSGKVTSIKAG